MNDSLLEIIGEIETRYLPGNGKELGRKAQILTDLGYLRHELLSDVLKEKQIGAAYEVFYNELIQSGLIPPGEIKKIELMYPEQAPAKLLEMAADTDEGLIFGKLPAFGERGLPTRITHYRLNLLGLFNAPAETAFNAASYFALEKAASYIQKPKLATLNLLADLQNYTVAFLESCGYQNCLAVFSANPSAETDSELEYSGQFRRLLKKGLEKHAGIFEEIDEQIFFRNDDKVDGEFLKQRENDETNRFVLRLIQLHQWMAGFYDGALDSDFGPVTLGSLKTIIRLYNEAGASQVKPGEVLARVKGNTYIFNALFFLQHYKNENYSGDNTSETLNILSESYQKAPAEEKVKFETNMLSVFTDISNNQDTLPVKKNGAIRRVFFGIKTFFKKAFGFARRLFRWIAEKTEHAAVFISHVVSMIYRFFKEAARHFAEGLKFLLGRLPVISRNNNGKMLYSNFDFSKDGLCILNSNDPQAVKIHMKTVGSKIKSMSFSLTLIAFLLQALKGLLRAGSPVTWPFLVIKLASSLKKLTDSYKIILTT